MSDATAADTAPATGTIAEHWNDLVTASLLGTDRRDPPHPPSGPLADLIADAVPPTPSARMLAAVAACTAVRRGGLRPRPPVALLEPPAPDPRPMISPAAARRWRAIATGWPVLEDEWLTGVERRDLRLPPDVLVDLLRRHRRDAVRAATVLRLGGQLAAWLIRHRPDLAPPVRRGDRGPAELGTDGLPPLAVPPSVMALLMAPAEQICEAIVAGVVEGTFGLAHRAVVVNFVARMRPDACAPLAIALRAADSAGTIAIAHTLADLADHRHLMLQELT